ncbi:MAG TPA: error-prone DNA polymerase [Steroidobacteraceae bacterium]|nr:error-prone DNA polymerase [Steroidobacteraceae bacterium]
MLVNQAATWPPGGYAELHALSHFSFLRGASDPKELMDAAHALGYAALAICDECSMAGAVRAWLAWQELPAATRPQLIAGSQFQLPDQLQLILLCTDREAYAELCQLITKARRDAPKGEYRIARADFESGLGRCLALWVPPRRVPAGTDHAALLDAQACWVQKHFARRAWLAVELHREADDAAWLQRCLALGATHALPALAAGDVHMHARERRALQDALTAIRHGCTLGAAGWRLFANGERHLRPLATLQRIYPPGLLAETLAVAQRCRFSFAELQYRYPAELVPAGRTPLEHLRQLVAEGEMRRWPAGTAPRLRAQLERELTLIAELQYENFFLTVHDIVAYARGAGILCQGRGSAANSVVCYVLGITEVDPARTELLFERFLSRERGEPPDIDVDFEHERREEVIQWIYRRYGRERTALAATVIRYRRRSAVRDLGKVLGLDAAQVERLAHARLDWRDPRTLPADLCALLPGVARTTLLQLAALVAQLRGQPRHLSQHVGGFVISGEPLHRLVPVENAAMPERTVIQWDKDDLEALGLLKVDVLALGMLTAIRRCLRLLGEHGTGPTRMQDIPPDDAPTYDMICRAETIGVFQIESRAQMSMLPRLRPRCYYDLVIEVAIVRPGPIQGGMVHPYLRRRQGQEPVSYPKPELRAVLEKTLGVPLFQEQVMKIAMVAANFTPGEADQLRRSMAAWKHTGSLTPHRERLLAGMRANGYEAEYAERIFAQIQGFADYGFPESHAASFALLTYVSCWLKCHHPAAFFAALVNSQPMGFYAPAQLLAEARRDGVTVLPVDVLRSAYECTLERQSDGALALRVGLNQIRGLQQTLARRIADCCAARAPASIDALALQAGLTRSDLQRLAQAGALRSLAAHRHAALWQALGNERLPALLQGHAAAEQAPALPVPGEMQELMADYRHLGFSTGRHPLQLLRARLARQHILSAAELGAQPDDTPVRIGGLVTHMQRPGTASGVVFVSLEDETGIANAVVQSDVFEAFADVAVRASLLVISGTLQNREGVRHVLARRLEDGSEWLPQLRRASRDFR